MQKFSVLLYFSFVSIFFFRIWRKQIVTLINLLKQYEDIIQTSSDSLISCKQRWLSQRGSLSWACFKHQTYSYQLYGLAISNVNIQLSSNYMYRLTNRLTDSSDDIQRIRWPIWRAITVIFTLQSYSLALIMTQAKPYWHDKKRHRLRYSHHLDQALMTPSIKQSKQNCQRLKKR